MATLQPYSVRILTAHLTAGQILTGIGPPAGYAYVLTDVATWQTVGTGTYVRGVEPASQGVLFATVSTTGNPFAHWTGRAVVPAGTTFQVECAVNACDVYISGYQLASS